LKKDIVLIVVDMQDFFLKNFTRSTKDKLIENQIQVIKASIKNHVPIILLEYKAGGKLRGKTTRKILEVFKPKPTSIIVKENNSGFTNTNLDIILKELKAKKLILMGANANACVQDTALGALKRGYKVITSKGVIASGSRKDFSFSSQNGKWWKEHTLLLDNVGELIKQLIQ
jgi:nicotinamidase-related amidase